jgi:hypothetical protein
MGSAPIVIMYLDSVNPFFPNQKPIVSHPEFPDGNYQVVTKSSEPRS